MAEKFVFKKQCTINGIVPYTGIDYSVEYDERLKEKVIKDGCSVICPVSVALRNKLGHVVTRPW